MSKPTPITRQAPSRRARDELLADGRTETGAAYVKPTVKSLGSWHLVVRTASPTQENNFFEFDTF